MSQRKPALKFAVCVNNAEYPASLELHKIYRVIPDEDAASPKTSEDVLYEDKSQIRRGSASGLG